LRTYWRVANSSVGSTSLQVITVPSFGKLPEETFAWVVTKTNARCVRLALPLSKIAEHVSALRCGLDVALCNDNKSSMRRS
jgi:hypothetical protein